jgi:hypothetical protein
MVYEETEGRVNGLRVSSSQGITDDPSLVLSSKPAGLPSSRQLGGLAGEINELGPIAFLVRPKTLFAQAEDLFPVQVPFVRRITQEHPVASHGRGEFEIGARLRKLPIGVLYRQFHEPALIAVRRN